MIKLFTMFFWNKKKITKKALFSLANALFIFLSLFLTPVFCTIAIANGQENTKETAKSPLKPNYSFSNISLNHLDWTSSTENRSGIRDFTYVEFEGGAGWNWGEFYMYADIENPTRSYDDTPANNQRFVFKPIVDIKLFDSDLSLHLQDYMFYSKDFYVHNIVTGLSYKINTDFGLWIQPSIGTHYQKSTYYSGFNGYLARWILGYDFKLGSEKFSLSQWNEFEWGRDKEDYQLSDGTPIGDGQSHGVQGTLAFWWHPTVKITIGIQYRYANHKLGFDGYQDGLIYSLKYNF